MEYTKEQMKEILNVRMTEYQMLNNTLVEMLEKNSSQAVIDAVNDGIESKKEEIDTLIGWISTKMHNECRSMYDEIKKQKSTIDETMQDKEYETEFRSMYDKSENPYYEDEKIKTTFSNRFVVTFGTSFRIPPMHTKRVSFMSSRGKQLSITIFDSIDTETKKPMIANVLALKEQQFPLSIDHFGEDGSILYTERYHGCKVMDVLRCDLNYENDNVNTIDMIISYSDVTYETAH